MENFPSDEGFTKFAYFKSSSQKIITIHGLVHVSDAIRFDSGIEVFSAIVDQVEVFFVSVIKLVVER